MAEEKDLEILASLFGELGYQISKLDLKTQATIYFESDDCQLLVAQAEDGNLTGLIAGHIFPLIHQPGNVGRVMALVVGGQFQNQGIGSLLLESLETWFTEKMCRKFEVNSGDHRESAHKFYESKGYLVDERRFIKTSANYKSLQKDASKAGASE